MLLEIAQKRMRHLSFYLSLKIYVKLGLQLLLLAYIITTNHLGEKPAKFDLCFERLEHPPHRSSVENKSIPSLKDKNIGFGYDYFFNLDKTMPFIVSLHRLEIKKESLWLRTTKLDI